MRMTNKIMRNNSLYNINQNKLMEDKLSNQMTNQSKITRPSDDPVVAIRALRLRTNVSTVTQYYEKNAKDADNWISLTGDALKTVIGVLEDLYSQATDASKKMLKSEDLEIILTQISSLTTEFYASGNVDYAGRYIFSGFRTDTPITFTEEDIKEFQKDPENKKTYIIEENFKYGDISRISYTNWKDAADIHNDGKNGTTRTDENDVQNNTLYRFRLSYNDLDDDFRMYVGGKDITDSLTVFDDPESAYQAVSAPVAAGDEPVIAYIPSTGEIVFSEDYYTKEVKENINVTVKYSKSEWEQGDINPVHYFRTTACDEKTAKSVMGLADAEAVSQEIPKVLEKLADPATADEDEVKAAASSIAAMLERFNTIQPKIVDEAVINDLKNAVGALDLTVPATVNDLTAALAGAATALAGVPNDPDQRGVLDAWQRIYYGIAVEYNVYDENRNIENQDIFYDVGYNQKIQVNSHANDIFNHGVQRDLDDFQIYLKQLKEVEEKISDIETKMKDYTEESDEYKALQLKLDAANKAYTYIRDNAQKKFENQITKYQSYLDDANVAVTDNGTLGSRLDLISSRLMSQKATFKDLQSNNEDVDVSELAVQLKSAELTYEAALMATSKIMQTNLMNYI